MDEIRLEQTTRRVRVRHEGNWIADSTTAMLAFTTGRHPEYLIPYSDVNLTLLDVVEGPPSIDAFGRFVPLQGESTASRVGRRYLEGPAKGLVQLEFERMDAWFEENEQMVGLVRDPYRRVDVIESDRHLQVFVQNKLFAESKRPWLLDETGLPSRWYVPADDVSWPLLTPSTTTSYCQYKGTARWYHTDLGETIRLSDIAWTYDKPVAEAPKLLGLVGFYNEHADVDTILDGVQQPKHEFSKDWMNPGLGSTAVPALHLP